MAIESVMTSAALLPKLAPPDRKHQWSRPVHVGAQRSSPIADRTERNNKDSARCDSEPSGA